jgi:hypothetical protein
MQMVLHLSFAFGLGATGTDSAVVAAYLPDPLEEWRDSEGRQVTFYPFLVITQRGGRDRAVWLPYWHTVEHNGGMTSKYGQWAPFMDELLFLSLMTQARQGGHWAGLDPRSGPSSA